MITTLVQFSRLVSEATSPEAILPLLADAARKHLGAGATAVLQIVDGGQLKLAASRDLPPELEQHVFSAETLGEELGQEILKACNGCFALARTLPLVSSQNLYGVLVLLFASQDAWGAGLPEYAHGLADMAAVALDQASQRAQLRRQYEELRASQSLLLRTEKLRALGQMAAGVAHDLKNIFNPMSLQIGLLKRRPGDQAAVADGLAALERMVRRGAETVERIRLFSHQSEEQEAAPADPNALVNEALEICRSRLNRVGGRLDLKLELGEVPWVRVHASEFVTALVNLIANADDAMKDSGTLTVRTRVDSEGVSLEVSDTGPGMPPEVRERIFEPFFTTKGQEGTGLGLAMVYAFVQRSGGTIAVDSAPGQGTTFALWFPAAPQPALVGTLRRS